MKKLSIFILLMISACAHEYAPQDNNTDSILEKCKQEQPLPCHVVTVGNGWVSLGTLIIGNIICVSKNPPKAPETVDQCMARHGYKEARK